MPTTTRNALNVRDFPTALHRELRVEAARRDCTLRQYLIWLLSRRNYTLRALGEHRLLEAKEDDGREA